MTDDQLREYIRRARKVAGPVGPQHAYWDVISDAEAILAGKPSIIPRESIEVMFQNMFEQ